MEWGRSPDAEAGTFPDAEAREDPTSSPGMALSSAIREGRGREEEGERKGRERGEKGEETGRHTYRAPCSHTFSLKVLNNNTTFIRY